MATSSDVTSTLAKFDIKQRDVELLREVGHLVEHSMGEFVADIYTWLTQQQEFQTFFGGNTGTQLRVQKLQAEHWQRFLNAELDDGYFAQRRHVGAVHAYINLPNDIYCATMSVAHHLLVERLQAVEPAPAALPAMLAAMNKLMYLDTYLVLDEISRIQREKIMAHSKSLMELSTPVTPIWEGILLLPLLGIVDSARTQDIMNKTLAKIAETRAKVFVMDISGVGAVDTAVANQLIKITKATQLMGCESIISGISPAIARTVVELGVNVGEVKTTATLRDAFEMALRAIGAERPVSIGSRSH